MTKYLEPCEIFMKKAKVDFELAKYAYHGFISNIVDIDLDIILFHLQQTVEKALKSVLAKNNIDFPKIHDIEELLFLLRKIIELDDKYLELTDLSDYAVEGRYVMLENEANTVSSMINLVDEFLNELNKK